LKQQKADGITKKLVGFEMSDKGIPRQGYTILNAEKEEIGVVTSGTMSPVLGPGIGMGYVTKECSKHGTEIFIQVRKRQISAMVVKPPFLGK
jgi:aminomethyltransferase